MNNKHKSITTSLLLDNILIFSPLWFPFIYIGLAVNFDSLTKLLFILSLFLFAETHFGSTWLFFFDKRNWNWIQKNSYNIVILPLYFALITIFAWKFNPTAVILIHYLASGWHVTKQSIGILKLDRSSRHIYNFFIYLISFICLAIGLINPGILSLNFSQTSLNLILLILLIVYINILFLSHSSRFSRILNNLLPVSTGIFIYLPILFFKDIATATVVGVGMHWCQYIAIMWSIELRKNQYKNSLRPEIILAKKSTFIKVSFVLLYALIMTSFALMGMPNLEIGKDYYSMIYLIPLMFQLYHFYIDGFIWKFSDPHIRSSVKNYLFSQ